MLRAVVLPQDMVIPWEVMLSQDMAMPREVTVSQAITPLVSQDIDSFLVQARERGYEAALRFGKRGLNLAATAAVQAATKVPGEEFPPQERAVSPGLGFRCSSCPLCAPHRRARARWPGGSAASACRTCARCPPRTPCTSRTRCTWRSRRASGSPWVRIWGCHSQGGLQQSPGWPCWELACPPVPSLWCQLPLRERHGR